MGFPVFSRPGKLVTKTRELWTPTYSSWYTYLGTDRPRTHRYLGWETITARRYGNFDLTRYSIEIDSKTYRSKGSTILKEPAYSISDLYPQPLSAGTSILRDNYGQLRKVPSSLYSVGFNSTLNERLLEAQGAEGMARAWPTNPTADTALFLGELKDGLPSIIGHNMAKRGFKGVGGEWLNFQFAIRPLVSDIQSFEEAWNEGPKRLEQLRRDSGKRVRRRRTIVDREEVTEQTSDVQTLGLWRQGNTYSMRGEPSITPIITRVTRTEKVWFVGSFYFHIPNRAVSPALNDMLDNLQYNWGLVPDIATVWNLVPFSWAVDYFTNLGSVFTNLSRLSQGNQFADAFVMRHTSECAEQYSPYYDVTTRQTVERKVRRRTNPFSLASNADLTGLQWANLLAVGWERHLSR